MKLCPYCKKRPLGVTKKYFFNSPPQVWVRNDCGEAACKKAANLLYKRNHYHREKASAKAKTVSNHSPE